MSPRDWIDHEKARRDRGERRPLSVGEHGRVNARYPDCTLQHCEICGAETGRCEDDAIYAGDAGPLCETCGAEQIGLTP